MADFLYFNGDSYSASAPTSWADGLANSLGTNYKNDAQPGCSNHRIFRSSIEQLINLKKQYSNITTVIGFSFVTREEVWDERTGSLFTLDKLLKRRKINDELKLKLTDLNINHQMVHFYTNLFMFVNLLESWNINYLLFSAAKNIDFQFMNWDHLKSLEIYKSISSNKKIIDLHSFCIPEWAKQNNVKTTDTGHLLADGHKIFAKYLLDNYPLLST